MTKWPKKPFFQEIGLLCLKVWLEQLSRKHNIP